MLALLKKKNPYQDRAEAVYAQLLERARAPVFYKTYGVPDTFDGRFDLLLLHIFLIINRLTEEGAAGREFSQALFDATFADMDQTLREMGIGDMGVPKHMRRMMKAFNGRMHIYSAALEDELNLPGALARNLYGTVQNATAEQVEKMQDYVRTSAEALAAMPVSDIFAGRKIF